ncbi:MAG: HAD family hydrolase [bacterium]
MIKNIVFDIGQVLLTFEPENYLNKYIEDRDKINSLAQITFRSKKWLKLDRGEWDIEEAVDYFIKHHPEYAEIIKKAVESWTDMLNPIEDTIEILKYVKNRGYNTYILSNFPEQGFRQIYSHFSFWDYLDGIIISAQEGYIKPEKELYEILLNRFELKPEATLFIDDSKKNIEGARKAGMKGIVFTNSEKLKKQLQNYNIL